MQIATDIRRKVDISEISSTLQQASDGLWYGPSNAAVSYPQTGNEECHTVEDNSFWFAHRNECIAAAVNAFPPPDNGTIFDIGGGNGFVAAGLRDRGFPVALVEPGRNGALNARRRGLETVICATTDSAGFKPDSLPAIGLFDVIEHIESDRGFVEQMHSLLMPNGRLYATVPAYPFLWSAEDEAAGHYRRYRLSAICDLLRAAGFEIDYATYIFKFLPLPIFFLRSLPFKLWGRRLRSPRQYLQRDHAVRKGTTRHLLGSILRPEVGAVSRLKVLKFGASCLVVASKREILSKCVEQ